MNSRVLLGATVWLALAGLAEAQPAAGPAGPRVWVTGDYLLWWVSKAPLPAPLITQGAAAADFPGALGQPGTQVLYGNGAQSFGNLSGLRLGAGAWIDDEDLWGVDASGFFLCDKDRSFAVQSGLTGSPVIAQPVVIPGFGEQSYLTSFPGLLSGSIRADSSFRLYGWEVNGLRNLYRDDGWQIDVLAGFRSLRLSEQLEITSQARALVPDFLTFLGEPLPTNARLLTTDSFGTSTTVSAPQVGTRVTWGMERLRADVTGKLAMGPATQTVAINGDTVYNGLNGLRTRRADGGILALPTNMGQTSHDRFVVVPELAGRLAVDVTQVVKLWAGYSFLYVSEVVRPGNQIDRTVNPNQVPSDPFFGVLPGGLERPIIDPRYSSFWAHGVNFGAELRF